MLPMQIVDYLLTASFEYMPQLKRGTEYGSEGTRYITDGREETLINEGTYNG
jgi:hypothetical protein